LPLKSGTFWANRSNANNQQNKKVLNRVLIERKLQNTQTRIH
jgi:hypothetical protein